MSHDLVKALRAEKAARDLVHDTMVADYPVGNAIHWTRGDTGFFAGIVTRHGFGDRIQVENLNTGKRYWITAADIWSPATRRIRGAA